MLRLNLNNNNSCCLSDLLPGRRDPYTEYVKIMDRHAFGALLFPGAYQRFQLTTMHSGMRQKHPRLVS